MTEIKVCECGIARIGHWAPMPSFCGGFKAAPCVGTHGSELGCDGLVVLTRGGHLCLACGVLLKWQFTDEDEG